MLLWKSGEPRFRFVVCSGDDDDNNDDDDDDHDDGDDEEGGYIDKKWEKEVADYSNAIFSGAQAWKARQKSIIGKKFWE